MTLLSDAMERNARQHGVCDYNIAPTGWVGWFVYVPREYCSLMYLPNLEELSLRTVFEFPKASRMKLLSSKTYRRRDRSKIESCSQCRRRVTADLADVVSSTLQCIHILGFLVPRAGHGDLAVGIDEEAHDALRCLGLALHAYIHPYTQRQRIIRPLK